MILQAAINEYLNSPRDDHRWMKDLTHADMDRLIASLNPRPKNLFPNLHLHQKVSFYLGVSYPQFSFWLDMGAGKTLLTLELIKYWWQCGDIRRALVFVLSDKAYPTWENQIKEYAPNIPFVALEESSKSKWDSWNKFDEGIILSTYPGTVAMCTVKAKGKRGKQKLELDKEAIAAISAGTDMLVFDESTRLGNTQSHSHKLCAELARTVRYRYALAGWPFGRDPTMLFAQQKIVDGGTSLGQLKGVFQQAFFSQERNRFARSKYSFNYTFKKTMSAKLSRMMQHRSITYEEHECTDVPEVVRILEPVHFTKEQQTYYEETVTSLMKARGKFTETKNMFLRLRQITSGFLSFTDEETSKRVQINFPHNPKLDRLIELVQELREDRKCVIFYDYTWSGQSINSAIHFLSGIKPIWLWSGTENPRKQIKSFLTDPKRRVALINNKVGAFSLDGLQRVANYIFYYESPVPVIERKQSEKRLARTGQPRKVFTYDLIVPNSVDERILDFHKEGGDLMAAIRKDPTALLKKE